MTPVRTPARLAVLPLLLPVVLVALTSCGGAPPVRTAAPAPAPTSAPTSALPTAPPAAAAPEALLPDPPAELAPPPPLATSTPAVAAAAAPRPSRSPLPLPAGPATAPTAPVVRPGGLSSVDWAARPLPAGTCAGTARAVVLGDLDGDGREEAAVPVECPADEPDAVLVFAGTADAVVQLGDALPADERGRLHATEVRDDHLVVTAVAPGADGADVAVTSRWAVRAAVLERTDRWEDPVEVLGTDG